ncbi:hypothetical protein PRIPAC_96361 [Pristionchus pacificus]|uniref:Uncharacterized protein n=1 Tax=Pristionchus pacificus TaxID=54126 RepID=A0A2A6D2Y7_PRIPA|nr:hypothetical protein PRIPAC_96361 [Pristionchus pacificus]|eukprot:PDM84706.1 hypothetical protein PRIPAC_33729 [Pristionchus pacificus]
MPSISTIRNLVYLSTVFIVIMHVEAAPTYRLLHCRFPDGLLRKCYRIPRSSEWSGRIDSGKPAHVETIRFSLPYYSGLGRGR